MPYSRKGPKFGRRSGQRVALLRSLARSMILHERIMTTNTKAKALRPHIEKIITKSRNSSLATRRLLLSRFNNDEHVVEKLLSNLGPRYKERKGGYTRITKVEGRPGSGRDIAVIEFV